MSQPSREALLVLQHQPLVARVQVDGLQLPGRVCANRPHEPQRVGYTMHNLLVPRLQLLIPHVAQLPIHRIVQVGEPAAQLAPHVIQRRGRVEVRADQPLRVRLPLLRIKTVQDVAAETGDLPPVDDLRRAGPRLRELARHPADADDGLVGAPDQHQAHLEEQFDLGVDGSVGAVGEELGAVAALEEEGSAQGGVPEAGFKFADFRGRDDGGEFGEFGQGGGDRCWIVIGDDLFDGFAAPC